MPRKGQRNSRCIRGHARTPNNLDKYEKCIPCRRQYLRQYHVDNRDKKIENTRQWRLSNPEKSRELNNRVRVLKYGVESNFRPWMESYFRTRQQGRCFYCGKMMVRNCSRYSPRKENLEHLIPFSRGGAHSWDNTVLACFGCNMKKRNKTAEEFIQETR